MWCFFILLVQFRYSVISFEWALTHGSFSRILPDSSNFSELPFSNSFKVWRKNGFHQSYVFSKVGFKTFFIVVSTSSLFILPECLINYHGGSHHHSQHLKTEEEFFLNLGPFSSRFMTLASCHALIIVFDCENSFHPSRAIQESFQFDSSEPIIS